MSGPTCVHCHGQGLVWSQALGTWTHADGAVFCPAFGGGLRPGTVAEAGPYDPCGVPNHAMHDGRRVTWFCARPSGDGHRRHQTRRGRRLEGRRGEPMIPVMVDSREVVEWVTS